uniref:hypothetical protein n=1 Tax=Lutibacter sp. TaxID=1925666 RepID=UPI00356682A3
MFGIQLLNTGIIKINNQKNYQKIKIMENFTFTRETSFLRPKLWRCCWRKLLFLPLIMAAMLMNNNVNAQIPQKAGNVPVLFPNGGFAVDGDAFARTPNLAVGDWWVNLLNPTPPRSVFDAAGDVVMPLPLGTEVIRFTDEYRGDGLDDDTTFPGRNKINDNPNTYEVGIGNVTPKDDMQNAVAVFTNGDPTLTTPLYVATGDSSDIWCLFAADRWRTNGASYNDFEFNQNTMILGANGFIISSAPVLDGDGDPTGGRTPGDILITIEYVRGGNFGQIYVDRWDKDGIGQEYYWKAVDLTLPQYANTIFVTPNLEEELSPWPIYDQPSPYTYAINQYTEGAINLSDIFGSDDVCGAVATVWARTKTSHSTQAELMDLAGIAQLNVGPPDLVAECPGNETMPACSTPEQINTAFNEWKAGFSYEGGVPTITESYAYTGGAVIGSNLNSLSPPDICGGTVSITYTVTDFCGQTDNCTATFTVTDAPEITIVQAPQNGSVSACDYEEGDFAAWIALQESNLGLAGGCDPQLS